MFLAAVLTFSQPRTKVPRAHDKKKNTVLSNAPNRKSLECGRSIIAMQSLAQNDAHRPPLLLGREAFRHVPLPYLAHNHQREGPEPQSVIPAQLTDQDEHEKESGVNILQRLTSKTSNHYVWAFRKREKLAKLVSDFDALLINFERFT